MKRFYILLIITLAVCSAAAWSCSPADEAQPEDPEYIIRDKQTKHLAEEVASAIDSGDVLLECQQTSSGAVLRFEEAGEITVPDWALYELVKGTDGVDITFSNMAYYYIPWKKDSEDVEPVNPPVTPPVKLSISTDGPASGGVWPGGSITFNFIVTADKPDQVMLSVSASTLCEAAVDYDGQTGRGTVTFTTGQEVYWNSWTTVRVSDGRDNVSLTFDVTLYSLTFVYDKISVPENETTGILAGTVISNLPEEDIVISVSDGWLSARLGPGTAPDRDGYRSWPVLLDAQRNGVDEQRGSAVSVSSADGVRTITVSVIQDAALEPDITDQPVTPVPGMVPFTDARFKTYCVEHYDTDSDGELSPAEAAAVKDLNVSGLGIRNLDGIECFTSLERLDFSGNKVRSLSLLTHPRLADIKAGTQNVRLSNGTTGMDLLDITGCRYLLHDIGRPSVMKVRCLKGQCVRNRPNVNIEYVDDDQHSQDYSGQGDVVVLQRHSRGDGIPVVLYAFGFIDRDVQSGLYDELMRELAFGLFDVEPYTSLKEYFDLVYVVNISENRVNYSGSEASERFETIVENAVKPSFHTQKMMAIGYVYNLDKRSNCSMMDLRKPVANLYIRSGSNYNDLSGLMQHELGGHGLGRLADEYVENGKQPLSQAPNVDTINDPEKVRWARFLKLPQYKNAVGIYEGANYKAEGWFRPSLYSIMGGRVNEGIDIPENLNTLNTTFNAPSRYAIYQRVMYYSNDTQRFGGEVSDVLEDGTDAERKCFEEFLEYDKINL